MKLYHSPRSRSVRPRWLLEEVGAPYELVTLDFARGEHKTPEYLRIHPHGAVPALEDGDLVLIESAAICSYLADKFPAAQLAPAVGTAARGRYYQWMHYAIATLEPPVLQVFLHTVLLPEAQRSARATEEGRQKSAEAIQAIGGALGSQPFILGEQFSAADILLGTTLSWARAFGLLGEHPEVEAYAQRLAARPAYRRAHTD